MPKTLAGLVFSPPTFLKICWLLGLLGGKHPQNGCLCMFGACCMRVELQNALLSLFHIKYLWH